MNKQLEMKKKVAKAALDYLPLDTYIGIGTGSTVNCFIELLEPYRNKILGAVSSSEQSTRLLKQQGINVIDMNEITELSIYIDGADEVDEKLNLIKGGGAALTREKILASMTSKFLCIVDQSKMVQTLGEFPLPIEVVPMARSHVARQLVKMFEGEPVYRNGCLTDQGNIILDVHALSITDPTDLERQINQIPGVVCNGVFAQNRADIVLVANGDRIDLYE